MKCESALPKNAKRKVRHNLSARRITGLFQLSVSSHGKISARINIYSGTIRNASFLVSSTSYFTLKKIKYKITKLSKLHFNTD